MVGAFFLSCENNNQLGLDANSHEDEVAPLTANFNSSKMFFEVTTSNTSMNGWTYAWDFGDLSTEDDTST